MLLSEQFPGRFKRDDGREQLWDGTRTARGSGFRPAPAPAPVPDALRQASWSTLASFSDMAATMREVLDEFVGEVEAVERHLVHLEALVIEGHRPALSGAGAGAGAGRPGHDRTHHHLTRLRCSHFHQTWRATNRAPASIPTP